MILKANNSTTTYFSKVERGFLPVVFIPCALLCFLIYRFSKRPLQQGETMAKRMQYFYSMALAILLGEVLFHVLPFLQQPYPATLGFGFLIALCVERLLPRLKTNAYRDYQSHIDLEHSVDQEEVYIKQRLVGDEDILSEFYVEESNKIEEEQFELRKRRTVVLVFVCAYIPFLFLDGFYFASFLAPSPVLQLAAFYVDKLLQTLALTCLLIHAFYHGMERNRWPWYAIVCCAWCLVCALSTVPAELGLDFRANYNLAVAVNFFYSCLAGILLWIAFYLNVLVQNQQQKISDTRSTVLRLTAFAATFLLSGILMIFI